jgi:excisionase family DNA binding protein
MLNQEDELWTVEDLCRVLKVKKSWAYAKIKTGEWPSVTLPGGRLLRVWRSDVFKLLGRPIETGKSHEIAA